MSGPISAIAAATKAARWPRTPRLGFRAVAGPVIGPMARLSTLTTPAARRPRSASRNLYSLYGGGNARGMCEVLVDALILERREIGGLIPPISGVPRLCQLASSPAWRFSAIASPRPAPTPSLAGSTRPSEQKLLRQRRGRDIAGISSGQ